MPDSLRWPDDESKSDSEGKRPAWRSVLNLTSPLVLDIEPAERRQDRGWFGDVILPVAVLFGGLALFGLMYVLTHGFGGWLP